MRGLKRAESARSFLPPSVIPQACKSFSPPRPPPHRHVPLPRWNTPAVRRLARSPGVGSRRLGSSQTRPRCWAWAPVGSPPRPPPHSQGSGRTCSDTTTRRRPTTRKTSTSSRWWRALTAAPSSWRTSWWRASRPVRGRSRSRGGGGEGKTGSWRKGLGFFFFFFFFFF